MPFTLAHPLFAAPLKLIKPQYLSLTGLILGSMGPDFEYFIVLEPYQTIGHNLEGLFLQVIPLSILFAYLFHYIMKAALVKHLPSLFNLDNKAHSLISNWSLNTIRKWIVFLVSILIGFYTHILLDGFTHKSGAMVALFPSLLNEFLDRPLYKDLQYAFSWLGLVVQLIIILWMLFRTKPTSHSFKRASSQQKLFYWTIAFAVMAITVLLKLMFVSNHNFVGTLFVAPFSGFYLGLLVASSLYYQKDYQKS